VLDDRFQFFVLFCWGFFLGGGGGGYVVIGTFQQNISYIVVVSFIGGVNRFTRIKPHNVVSIAPRNERDSNSQL
jgi:hypothetical protein